jgi:hypothetical protein
MSALSIQPTFPIFTETDGLPLENGYIWIGAANLDPQGNPINVYWDAALTIQAPQPIRTLNGYPSRSGTPARLYVNSDYSIRVQNSKGSMVYSAPSNPERFSALIVSVDYRGVGMTVQQAFDDVAEEIDALQTEIDNSKKINYNWMGFFETWQNGHAFKVRTGAREIGCSGATFARIGFADDNVTMLHVKGVYQPSGIRIQRNNLNINTSSATMVMNLTQTETKPLLGQNICLQLHALKATGFTGSTINVRLQYSKEPQQPIVLADGAYTSGQVVLVEDDFTLTTSMTAKDSPYVITGLLPQDAIQVAIVVTVPWTSAAGVDDYVDVEGCFLTLGTTQSEVIEQTFNDLIVKAKTRYQTTYPYSAPRGATTKAGSVRVTAINTSTTTAVVTSVRFDPPMAIIPQVLMQSPLSGTENRWENETTGVFVNGLPYNLSDQGITLQNNGAVTAGDVLLCHWTARCVF